jgi:hypothetical protein
MTPSSPSVSQHTLVSVTRILHSSPELSYACSLGEILVDGWEGSHRSYFCLFTFLLVDHGVPSLTTKLLWRLSSRTQPSTLKVFSRGVISMMCGVNSLFNSLTLKHVCSIRDLRY